VVAGFEVVVAVAAGADEAGAVEAGTAVVAVAGFAAGVEAVFAVAAGAAVVVDAAAGVAESADVDFFERLLDFGLEAVSEAAAEFESAVEESALFDFDLDFGLEVPAADESDAAVLED
jgi:hypothetical protein